MCYVVWDRVYRIPALRAGDVLSSVRSSSSPSRLIPISTRRIGPGMALCNRLTPVRQVVRAADRDQRSNGGRVFIPTKDDGLEGFTKTPELRAHGFSCSLPTLPSSCMAPNTPSSRS